MSVILKSVAQLSQAKLICRALSSSSVLSMKAWRLQRDLPRNRTSEGILTDGPDYTYLDGRPTPLLQKQKKRMLRQRELANRIVELCSEVDFAKERYQTMEAAKEQERQSIIANRLKPKGTALFKKQ